MGRIRFGWIMSLVTCAGLSMTGIAQAASTTADQWIRIDDPAADFFFLRSGVDFAKYDSIMIDPLSVWYADSASHENDELPGNIQLLCESFEHSFSQRLQQYGFGIATEPGPGVLRLHVEIIDMKLNSSDGDARAYSSRYLFAVLPGKITLIGNISDSQSGDVLMRMADVEKERLSAPAAHQSVWDEVDAAFDHWSKTLSASLMELPASSDYRMVNTTP